MLTYEQIMTTAEDKLNTAMTQTCEFKPQDYTFVLGGKCVELILKALNYSVSYIKVNHFSLYGIRVEIDVTNEWCIKLFKEIKE